MRIAQVAPLYEAVPPKAYGGTERVVSYLTEELVRQGHHVTLFATGDSRTSAELVPVIPEPLRGSSSWPDWAAPHVVAMEQVAAVAGQFDVIHFHVDSVSMPYARRIRTPSLLTLHGRLDLDGLAIYFREFREANVVSVSDAQRAPLPWLNWIGTVHHGVPANLLPFSDETDGYLAFCGRISPEKRCDRAIEIARRSGIPLRIAAKVDAADADYFDQVIRPMLDDPLVEYVGEIGEAEKAEFLGRARALVFPIDWPEPFGLVMIEAMSTGTPVIAFRNGSVPEVVEDGITGRIVGDLDAAVRAVEEVRSIPRRLVRRRFVERFSAERMARDYVAAYERLVGAAAAPSLRVVTGARSRRDDDVAALSGQPLPAAGLLTRIRPADDRTDSRREAVADQS